MTCPDATGSCTLVADSEPCITPKESVALVPIVGLYMQGADDGFILTWDTTTSYPTETVHLLYRIQGGSEYFPIEYDTDRDDGTITVTTLTKGDIVEVWIRPETATEYGEWSTSFAIADASWDQDTLLVEHLGIPVTHDGEAVSYNP